jgi:hypothetical protein
MNQILAYRKAEKRKKYFFIFLAIWMEHENKLSHSSWGTDQALSIQQYHLSVIGSGHVLFSRICCSRYELVSGSMTFTMARLA